jgi:hypothetical protein
MDIEQILKNLNNDPVELNVSNKYDVLLEYYKSLALKFILTVERSVYNSLSEKKLLCNCNNNCCYRMVNDFMHGLFSFNIGYGIEKNLKELIENIIEISKEDKMSVLKKTFKIVDAYYSSIDRTKLRIDNINHYVKDILEKFKDYLSTYQQELIELVSDTEPFHEEITFNLSVLE